MLKSLNEQFIEACKVGDLKKVEYLLTSNELDEKADIFYNDDLGLFLASANGHLNLVTYLLESPNLQWHSTIFSRERHFSESALYAACSNGHPKVVKKLFENLSENPTGLGKRLIEDSINCCFLEACRDGDLKNLKYILKSPDLKNYLDIYVDNDLGFKFACENGHLDIVNFLIFEANYEKTHQIERILNQNDKEIFKDVAKMFEIKEKLTKIFETKEQSKRKSISP